MARRLRFGLAKAGNSLGWHLNLNGPGRPDSRESESLARSNRGPAAALPNPRVGLLPRKKIDSTGDIAGPLPAFQLTITASMSFFEVGPPLSEFSGPKPSAWATVFQVFSKIQAKTILPFLLLCSEAVQ